MCLHAHKATQPGRAHALIRELRLCAFELGWWFAGQHTCKHTRYQVLIYSNEAGRITRGWSRGAGLVCWRVRARVCVCMCRGAPSSPSSLPLFSPPRLFFSRLQMRPFAWLRRRKAAEMKEEGNGDEKRKRAGGRAGRTTVRFRGRQKARRQKHTVPGRCQRFQDGCRRRLSSTGPAQSPPPRHRVVLRHG